MATRSKDRKYEERSQNRHDLNNEWQRSQVTPAASGARRQQRGASVTPLFSSVPLVHLNIGISFLFLELSCEGAAHRFVDVASAACACEARGGVEAAASRILVGLEFEELELAISIDCERARVKLSIENRYQS